MGISFLPKPSHRVFKYQPRFWNEQDEAMQKRYKKYGKEYKPKDKWEPDDTETKAKEESVNKLKSGEYVPGKHICDSYREGIGGERSKERNSLVKKLIVLVTLGLMIIVAYYLAQGLTELIK